MEKIAITRENYDFYKEFVDITDKSKFDIYAFIYDFYKKRSKKGKYYIWGATVIFLFFKPIVFLSIFTIIFTILDVLWLWPNIEKSWMYHKFSKKHPDFDTSLDVEEVKKSLKKYEELSNKTQNIAKNQEEKLLDVPFNNLKSIREKNTTTMIVKKRNPVIKHEGTISINDEYLVQEPSLTNNTSNEQLIKDLSNFISSMSDEEFDIWLAQNSTHEDLSKKELSKKKVYPNR